MSIPQAPLTKSFIAQFLPANPVILEAGAHIGRDTIKMAKLWPESTIYAFEPVPELFEQLVKNTHNYPHIICYQLALSDKVGTATLYVSTGASTAASSLLEPYEYRKKRPEVLFTPCKVATTTIDVWAQQYKIDHIDFMWLDMQGHELSALTAATTLLSTTKALLIEASLTERFKDNPLYEHVLATIEGYGFKILQQDIPKHDKVNLFFIKNETL
jgi:2-O-methyltransferase